MIAPRDCDVEDSTINIQKPNSIITWNTIIGTYFKENEDDVSSVNTETMRTISDKNEGNKHLIKP